MYLLLKEPTEVYIWADSSSIEEDALLLLTFDFRKDITLGFWKW